LNIKKIQCKSNFCDMCCEANIFWKHSNTLFECKKLCRKTTKGENNQDDYKNVCFNSTNPNKNIYTYCDNKFNIKSLNGVCKKDMCHLCCININSLKKRKHSYKIIKSCFKECADRFIFKLDN